MMIKVDPARMVGIENDPEMKTMISNLEIDSNAKVLEMGCGNPPNGCLIAELCDLGIDGWGCDYGCHNIHRIKHFVKGDFVLADLPYRYFDVVIDVSAIHHFPFKRQNINGEEKNAIFDTDYDIKAAQKVKAILKDTGVWYLSEDQFQIGQKYNEDSYGCIRQYDWSHFNSRLVDAAGFKLELARFYEVDGSEVHYQHSIEDYSGDVNSIWAKLVPNS